MTTLIDLDVALVPSEARHWPPTVCIVVDQLRASSTITAALDGGCSELIVTRALDEARAIARDRDVLLAGERGGRTPRGFHANNSPVELARIGVRGRVVVLSTSNGTLALRRVAPMPAVLVGCLLNARAAASAAVSLALAGPSRIGVLCAGVDGRFALDDTVAAGAIASAVVTLARERGAHPRVSDAAVAAIRLRAGYENLEQALRDSVTGDLVTAIDADDDIPFCARLDVTTTVGLLRAGSPLRIVPFSAPR